jgi:DNA-directed RNA polymerase subunit H (RpoH/RPB5)
MSAQQFEQYKNLHIFAKEWRGYTQTSPESDENTFRVDMQTNKYVRLDYMNKELKPVLIYLFAEDSNYANSSQDLRRLLSRIKEVSYVILVTKDQLKTYSLKAINDFNHLRVKSYLQSNFSLIAPNGPLCFPHRILSKTEVDDLLNKHLTCHIINLPKILQSDVQCIWIGAEVGDIVEITMNSDISGSCIKYHVVLPNGGKITSFKVEEKKAVINKSKETKKAQKKTTKNEETVNENADDLLEDDDLADVRAAATEEIYNTDEEDAVDLDDADEIAEIQDEIDIA